MKPTIRFAAVIRLILAPIAAVRGATLYWSGDGISQGGVGTWNTSLARWSATPGGPFTAVWNNTAINSAVLDTVGGAVTIGTAITNETLTVNVGGYSLAGSSKITFQGPNAGVHYTVTTPSFSMNSPMGTSPGSVFNVTGAGRVALNNSAGNTISKYRVTAGVLSAAAPNRFGTAPGALVADFITLDGGGFGADTTLAYDLGSTRGITLGTGGGKLGVASATITLTISSPVTGSGTLSFPSPGGFPMTYGAAGIFVLSNPNNNYAGGTTVQIGTLRLDVPNVLPNSTTLTLNGGDFDVLTNSETIGKLVLNSSSSAVSAGTGGTITATNAAGFDMRNGTCAAILAGAGIGLTKTTSGVVDLTGASTYTGGTAHNAGTLRVGSSAALGAANSSVTFANGVTLSTSSSTARTLNHAHTINGDIILGQAAGGTGLLTLAGSVNLAAGTRSIQIDNASDTISGVVTNGGLTKAGTGTLNLTGNNTYAGGTTVNLGLLNISGANNCPGPTLVSSGRLNTTPASIGGGSYSVADGAVLGIKQIVGGASLNVSDLTLGASTTEFDFARLGFPATNLVYDAVAIAVNGTVVVDLKGFDNTNSATLLEYAGLRSGIGNFTLGTVPPRVTASIDDTIPGKVVLNATGADTLVWVGDLIGTWDVNNAGNAIWKLALAGTPTDYQENAMQGDTVRFDDTLAGTTVVSLPGTVSPFTVTVDNTVTNYTFAGVGKISGTCVLTKNGSAEMIMATTNDYSGGSFFNGGTVSLGNNSALGTGKVTINAAVPNVVIRSDSATARTLSVAVDLNGGATFGDTVNNGDLTASGVIAGSGGLTKEGSAVLNVSGANTFSGGVNHNAGTLRVNNNTALGAANSAVTMANGVTLSTTTTSARTLNYSFALNGDVTLGQAVGGTAALTLAGSVNLTGGMRTIAISNATDTISATITNGGLTKVGTGTLVLTGTNAYAGGTVVNEGTLQGTTAGLQGNITNGTAVTFNQTFAGTYGGVISGTGTLTKSGTGSVTLSGNNEYTGITTVSAGTLLINGSLASPAITVNSGGALGGAGPIGGSVTVNSGGSVGAGSSAGSLILTNGLNLSAGGTNIWEPAANSTSNPGTDFDQVVLSGGNLALGGTSRLLIKFTGTSTTPTNTDAFWQSSHSWPIITLTGTAANPGNTTFATISGTNGITAGTFSTSVDGSGNVFLNYTSASLPPPPQSQISPNVAGQVLSWSSSSGYRYYVEYKDDLNAALWSTLTNIVAAGATTAIHDDSSPLPPKRFYRVVSKPPYN